ncbi:hypothetical protein ACHAXN_013268 [Cyclotella atomus]
MILTVSSLMLLMQLLHAHAAHATVPKICIQQLEQKNINLHRILHESNGVLRISTKKSQSSVHESSNDDYNSLIHNIGSHRKGALSALCACPAFDPSSNNSNELLFKQLLESYPKDIQQITLPDGTKRRTLATATVGFGGRDSDTNEDSTSYPLQLPTWVQQHCGQDAYDTMENLRDAISQVVDLFVDALDNKKGEGKHTSDGYYRDVLRSANHLEHFHVYTKDGADDYYYYYGETTNGKDNVAAQQPTTDELNDSRTPIPTTLDYHTDAGFFLSFVPAMDCHSLSVDNTSFYIQSQEEPLRFEEDEVVILIGAGAQYWMNNNNAHHDELTTTEDDEEFVAAPHALQLLPNAHRSWYGKMHLLPSSLTTNAFYDESVKYGDVLPTFQLDSYKAYIPSLPVDGCGVSTPLETNQIAASTVLQPESKQRHNRRRMQHVGSPANCNNETNFFCWYQCLSIPNAEHSLDYLRDGHSLYCLDPSMLSDNSVADAAAPCKDGYTHNSACSGSWQVTDPSLEGYEFPNYAAVLAEEEKAAAAAAAAYPAPENGDAYCYGGTSMYMDGFNWIGSTCVIYLFPQWVLSTPGKFALGCLGSILFGILLEYVLWKRRVVYTMSPGRRRLVLSVLVYGLQLTMGYFIMLVIMTYSGPLFVSVVGGMMMGHATFNAQDSFMKWRDGPVKDSQEAGDGTSEHGRVDRASTELSNSYQNVKTNSRKSSEADEEALGGCCGMGVKNSPEKKYGATEKTKLKENIPEGATPCCQYVL